VDHNSEDLMVAIHTSHSKGLKISSRTSLMEEIPSLTFSMIMTISVLASAEALVAE